jgi:hypothetical protein
MTWRSKKENNESWEARKRVSNDVEANGKAMEHGKQGRTVRKEWLLEYIRHEVREKGTLGENRIKGMGTRGCLGNHGEGDGVEDIRKRRMMAVCVHLPQ